MSKRNVAQLKTLTDQVIKTNNAEQITAAKDNPLRKDFIDSFLNLVDGGLVIDAEVGYSTIITPSSDYSFATKKYVDDLIGSGGLPVTDLGSGDYRFEKGSNFETFGDGKDISVSNISNSTEFSVESTGFGGYVSDLSDTSINTLFYVNKDGIRYRTQDSLFSANFKTTNITDNRLYEYPDRDGTFATLDDITDELDGYLPNTLDEGKIFIGDASNLASAVTPSGDWSIDITGQATNSGLLTKDLPSLSTGNLKYNGTDWVFDNTSYQPLIVDETLTENSLLTVSPSGLIINSGYEMQDILFDISRTIDIDVNGNVSLSDNAYLYADDIYIKNNNGTRIIALSSTQNSQLLLGGGSLSGGVKTNIFVGTDFVKTNLLVSESGTLNIANINTANGTMSIGGLASGSTYTLNANIAGSPTCSTMIATCNNSGVGGSGDIIFNPGEPNGGGVGCRVAFFRSTRSTTSTLGRKTITVASASAAPTVPDADSAIMYVADIAAGRAAFHFLTEDQKLIKLYQTNVGTPFTVTGTASTSFDLNFTLPTIANTNAVLQQLITQLRLTNIII